MTFRRAIIAVLLLLAGFAAGRGTARPTVSPTPVAEPVEIQAASPTDRACKSELASAKAQLAICLAYRRSPEPPASAPPPSPEAEMDEETAKLVRARTTNTDVLLVQEETGGMRAYLPGRWPPPGGPPPNARVVARKVEGGIEWYRDGGATEMVRVPDRPMLCPCPRDADAAAP